MTARHRLHARAVREVAAQLAARGHIVVIHPRKIPSQSHRADLFVDNAVWVAVRCAKLGEPFTHAVTVNGKKYSYDGARRWIWNLDHRHGHQLTQRPDAWVLIGNMLAPFVIPDAAVGHRKTAHLHHSNGGTTRTTWIWQYRDKWDVIPLNTA